MLHADVKDVAGVADDAADDAGDGGHAYEGWEGGLGAGPCQAGFKLFVDAEAGHAVG